MKSLVTAKQNATQNISVARTQKSHLATQYRLVYFVFEKGKGTKAFSPWCKGHPMSCKFLLEHFKGIKAMTRGHGGDRLIASLLLCLDSPRLFRCLIVTGVEGKSWEVLFFCVAWKMLETLNDPSG